MKAGCPESSREKSSDIPNNLTPGNGHSKSEIRDPKSEIDKAGYIKFCALLQNLSYLSFHATESRHMKRYLPGNFRRFFRTQGFRWRTLRDASSCFWHGACAGQPAGLSAGESLRQRIQNYDG